MNTFLLKLTHPFIWHDYNARNNSRIDYIKGCGYYIPVGWLFTSRSDNLKKFAKTEIKMSSGKIGIYKLLDYKVYRDPDDMIKESYWQFLGYKGEKLLADMTFEEYLEFSKE